jgi:hypothetical protein
MKYRLPLFVTALLLTALIIFWQPRMESAKPASNKADCGRVKQCLSAENAWPPGMEYCPAVLVPWTHRERSKDNKWGYSIDSGECSKQQLIAPRYDIAEKFGNNGLAKVSKNGKWGYINLKGGESIPLNFDEIGDFNFGLVPVKSNNKWGYYNAQGFSVTPFLNFDEVSGIWRNERSAVQINKKWGYINPTGETVIAPKFGKASEFMDGLAKVELNGKWGVIDTTGKTILPPNYDVIFSVANVPLLLVSLDGKYGYFDYKGNEVIPLYLTTPVKVRDGGSMKIQANLNETTWTLADNVPAVIEVNPNQWFYINNGEKEKLRFDENGKAQLWRNGEWFYMKPEKKQ